jgi:hypothetical protein
MNQNADFSPSKHHLALCVTVLLVLPLSARAETPQGPVVEEMGAACQVWISSLEATNTNHSVWEFPFGAPRPDQLTAQEMKTVLSLRHLVQNSDTEKLTSQVEIVARIQETIPVQMRFWLAYAQSTLHQKEACQENLELLLQVPEGHQFLEPGQQVWVLTALADHSFLLGDRDRAAVLYGQMAASKREQLNLWGQYQLAGMEFLERNFADANRRYKVVCESEKSATWREHACAMAEIAGRLSSLNLKGEAHGGLAVVSP